MKRLISLIVAGVTLLAATLSFAETSQPLSKILTSFDFNVVGLGLNASPDYQGAGGHVESAGESRQ